MIDNSYSSIASDVWYSEPKTGSVYIAPDEPRQLRVFIDKSIIGVFNGKQCIALRVYPEREDRIGV